MFLFNFSMYVDVPFLFTKQFKSTFSIHLFLRRFLKVFCWSTLWMLCLSFYFTYVLSFFWLQYLQKSESLFSYPPLYLKFFTYINLIHIIQVTDIQIEFTVVTFLLILIKSLSARLVPTKVTFQQLKVTPIRHPLLPLSRVSSLLQYFFILPHSPQT